MSRHRYRVERPSALTASPALARPLPEISPATDRRAARNPRVGENIAATFAQHRPKDCPTCRQPVSYQLHVVHIAGHMILDCPTCWTTTVFDETGHSLRRAPN